MARLPVRSFCERLAVVFVCGVCSVVFGQAVEPAPSVTAKTDESTSEGNPNKSVQQTVVTATRYETPASQVGTSVTVISEDRLNKYQLITVEDALRDVPGVDVIQTGGLGGQTSVFIRGSNANHTLVLIDGMDVSDPSSPDAAFDFGDLSTDQLSRIEVLRGPASSLYGSNAIGGVVNLITKKGEGSPHFSLLGEGGRYGTGRTVASANGGNEWGNYSVSASDLGTMGLPLGRDVNGNIQSNPYQRAQLIAKAGLTPGEIWEFNGAVRYLKAQGHLFDFPAGEAVFDPNFTYANQVFLSRVEVRAKLLGGRWQQTLGFSNLLERRNVDNLPDPAAPTSSMMSRYSGARQTLDWQHQLRLADSNEALLFLEARQETATVNSVSNSSFGPFEDVLPRGTEQRLGLALQDVQHIGGLSLSASGRADHHSVFGNVLSYTVAGAFEVVPGGVLIRASNGTGFKAPTLYQRLDPAFGNPSLRPERSISFDAGFELPLPRAFRVGATYFSNRIRDLISFDPNTFQSINFAAAQIRGVESFAQWSGKQVNVRLDYTYMEPRDLESGHDLLRRARHKLSANVDTSPISKLTLTARANLVGSRLDNDFSTFPAQLRTLSPYCLISLTGQYRVLPAVTLYARVENLLGQRYQEILGYPTPGRSFFAGARMDL